MARVTSRKAATKMTNPNHSNRNLPSHRYDIFITAFEREVAKRQDEIAAIDRLQRPYEIVRVALEAAKLLNDTELRLHKDGITTIITPLDTDAKGAFDHILTKIGHELKTTNLHPTGEWTTTIDHNIQYTWRLRSPKSTTSPPTIRIVVDVPWEGTKYLKVTRTRKLVQYEDITTKTEWLEA